MSSRNALGWAMFLGLKVDCALGKWVMPIFSDDIFSDRGVVVVLLILLMRPPMLAMLRMLRRFELLENEGVGGNPFHTFYA
jgi:hypothetical protein